MVANRGAMFSFHKQPLAFSSRFDVNDGGRQRLKLHGGKEELFWPSPLGCQDGRRVTAGRNLVRDSRITGLHLLERKDHAHRPRGKISSTVLVPLTSLRRIIVLNLLLKCSTTYLLLLPSYLRLVNQGSRPQ